MATKALSLKAKLIKTLRLRGFVRKFLNVEKNSKILKFLTWTSPDASGGTFRIYRKKKQEIHDEDTSG
jgi:hypothetical protein